MKKTVYVCDKCGKETSIVSNMLTLGVWTKDIDNIFDAPTNKIRTIDICRPCLQEVDSQFTGGHLITYKIDETGIRVVDPL